MRKALLLTLALFCSALCFGQQTRPQDVTGWTSIKWGMTVDEAKAALGDKAHLPSPTEREFARDAMLVTDKFNIGICPSSAYLQRTKTDPVITKVSVVVGDQKDSDYVREEHFTEVKNLLIRKYGVPTSESSKPNGRGRDSREIWIFPSTTITLWWGELGDGFGFVSLEYEAVDKKSVDAL